MSNRLQWQKFYEKKKTNLLYPDENLVRLVHSFLISSSDPNFSGVLDFGCGGGRHLQLLDDFDPVYTLDVSEEALQRSSIRCPRACPILFAPEALVSENSATSSGQQPSFGQQYLSDQFLGKRKRITDVKHLLELIGADSLSLVIAWGVFHYISLSKQEELLSQFSKLLKPGGRLFMTFRAQGDTHLRNQEQLESLQFTLYDKVDVSDLVSRFFCGVELGYSERRSIGYMEQRIAHWIVQARKK